MSNFDDDDENNVVSLSGHKEKTKQEDDAAEDKDEPKQAKHNTDVLVGIADDAKLFHSPSGSAFADIEVDGHRETWPVRTKGFRRWLTQRFYIATNKVPGSEALQAALNVIEAKAHFDGPELSVGLRVGSHSGKLYLDLADENWRAVEIDATGWRQAAKVPTRFRRPAGMRPLPMPEKGGSIEVLQSFLNVETETKEQFVLAVAWLLASLRDGGPYPVLALAGEQGSAKSTASKLMRSLVDPNAAPLRALPREDRDLFIAANNGHVLAFDNVSGLPNWISDTICRLATGGGFSVRQLYSDQDEILFDAQRPLILNGIEDIIERPDLADRSLFLALKEIPKKKRRPGREIVEKFGIARPKILGALLDVMVVGLRRLPKTELSELPRMADFALWVTTCEAALWKKGTFYTAYTGNTEEATKTLIEGDIVAAAICAFMADKPEWEGPAKTLLADLDRLIGEGAARKKEWPKTPKSLSGKLTRLAPSFRQIGLQITRLPRTESIRPLRLEWEGKRPSFSSAPSSNPRNRPLGHDDGDAGHDDKDEGRKPQPSCCDPWENPENDTHDVNDGHSPLYSPSDDDPFPILGDDETVGDGDPFASLRDPSLKLKREGDAA
jgi:hypothetical protein